MTAPLPEEGNQGTPEQVRLRRSPKILSFLLAGALLGAIVALILTLAFPPNNEFPASQVFGFLLLLGLAIGGALGALVALIADRVLQRRARVVEAVREEVVAPPEDDVDSEPALDDASDPAVDGPNLPDPGTGDPGPADTGTVGPDTPRA
jgi:hypothetical protein